MKTAVLKPLKALNPRTPDTKYTGNEPEWRTQPDSENRISRLGAAFHWYGYHYGKKEVKEFIIDWLARNDRQKEAKEFARVPESTITNVYGWLARMSLMGLELNEHEELKLNDQIKMHIGSIKAVKEVVEKIEEPVVPKVTIQDRLREKVSEAAGEIEGMFDDMILAGAKMSADYKPMVALRSMNVAPQMVGVIADDWKQRMAELQEVTAGKDAQLVEGYSNFSKIQMRNLIKFCEQVIADCGNYVQIKKVERKPRAKKAVSPEKLASKFKFLKDFAELKLTSESPAKLVGASEAYLYDTKKRKLVHVVADQHIGSFSVKGSSIVGFDTANSQQKTLRKPAEQLKALLGSGKPAARKFFKDIKATEVKFNGRGNENLIILKTW
jgi:predicted transcriptional regulator